MTYQHLTVAGEPIALPVGKVLCIGQNYQDHIAEMQSKTAPQALFFIKPSTALCHFAPGFSLPHQQGAVHNETELAVLIAKPLRQQEEVFNERISLVFKKLRIVRMVDAKRNTLVYLTYSDRVIEGSPQNSVTAVPVARSTPIPLTD